MRGKVSGGRGLQVAGALAVTLAAAYPMATPAMAADVTLALATASGDFAIAPQPLPAALSDFGRQSGLQVTAHGDLVRGLSSDGVTGTMDAEQALRRLLVGTGLTYSLSGSGAVVIEKAAVLDNGRIQLAPITVAGELQQRSLQDTHTSVSVFRGEELERSSDRDLHDVVERTANVSSAYGEDGFSIRGIDQRGAAPGGSGLVVNTMVDGASIVTNQSTFFGPYSTWDLEQIEVLRGPQSTQQGRNALAGAIVIRSKDPTYDTEIKGRGDLAQRDTMGGAFALNAPVIDDKMAVRFSVDHKQSDGFVHNPTLDDDAYDAQEQTTLRGKVRLDPTEDLTAILSYTHARNFGGDNFVDPTLFPGERVNLSGFEDPNEGAEHDLFGLRLTYDLPHGFTIESETTYLDSQYERYQALSRTPTVSSTVDFRVMTESLEQELRLRYERERLKGVVGGFFADIGQHSVDPTYAIDTRTDTQNAALFGEVEFQAFSALPGLWLIGGGRYDHETATVKSGGTEQEATFNAFLPKVGVNYHWTGDLSTSFVIQRGYRAGGTQINGYTGAVNEFDPSYTWNYEFGVRSEWFDDRLVANANLFYTDWSDQQARILGPSGASSDFDVRNAGNSELYGGELDLKFAATRNLDLFASVGYVATEFVDFDNRGEDLSGNEFPFAPQVTASVGAAYYFGDGFEIQADANYSDGFYGDVSNSEQFKSDSRFVVNAKAGYEQDHWGAFLYVRNLFDEDYLTLAFPTNSVAGEPLTVGAFFTVNF